MQVVTWSRIDPVINYAMVARHGWRHRFTPVHRANSGRREERAGDRGERGCDWSQVTVD